MMKKGLIALLLTFPLALTACLDGDSEPDPMLPGFTIYDVSKLQKDLALIPADAGVRLAMLLAEADKQGKNWSEVQVDGTSLLSVLFSSSVTVSQNGSQYRIEYAKQESGSSRYSYDGAIVVETGGKQLSATDVDNAWRISATGFDVYYAGSLAYEYVNVPVEIYREGSAYVIDVVRSQIRYKPADLTSDCSGSFMLAATDASLAYSACHGEKTEYKLNGSLEGLSFSALNTAGRATRVKYEAVNLHYGVRSGYLTLISGTEKCSLSGAFDYDPTTYPSHYVEVVYTNGRGVMTYNGHQR